MSEGGGGWLERSEEPDWAGTYWPAWSGDKCWEVTEALSQRPAWVLGTSLWCELDKGARAKWDGETCQELGPSGAVDAVA